MSKISVCIIMKNESSHIEKCLKALIENGFGDNLPNGEIVLVDTGSEDNSIKLAEKYINKVHTFEWVNDFSKAKNYAISLSSYDFVLIIDADEYMTDIDLTALDIFMTKNASEIGQIQRANETLENGIKGIIHDKTERFFNKNKFHFEKSIHEQVVPIKQEAYSLVTLPVFIDHDGYLGSKEELRKKADRNNTLLFKELESDPNNPYLYFQIGQSYLLIRDYQSACQWFSKGLAFDVDPSMEYVQLMITGYGDCLIALEQYDTALSLAGIYDDFSFCPEYVFMMGQIYLNCNQPIQAYKEFIKCLSMTGARTEGVTSYFPLHNIGVINEMLGEKNAAIDFYKKAASLGYERSRQRLSEIN